MSTSRSRELWDTARENGWDGPGLKAPVKEKWGCEPADPPADKRKAILHFFDTTTPEMWLEEKKAEDIEEIFPPKREEELPF